MEKENYFSKMLSEKSDTEIQHYLDHKDQFQTTMVQAAIWEMERRGKSSEQTESIQKKCIKKKKASLKMKPEDWAFPSVRFLQELG